MLAAEVLHWRGAVVLTRDLTVPGDRSEFYSRVRRGEYTAVTRGAFVTTARWNASTHDERYLLLIEAASLLHPDAVFSHYAAAAVWRLPIVGKWPSLVHVIGPPDGIQHSNSLFRRHLTTPPEAEYVGSARVTALARTVTDMAATAPFGVAVTMADAALRRNIHPLEGLPPTSLTKDDLVEELAARDLRQGTARAARVIRFADPLADRPGESMSRVAMEIAHIPMPSIQVEVRGRSGRIYFADFFWPQWRKIGEFDGTAKYRDPDFLRGRTPEQALSDEKAREDDLRAAGYGMTRWGWSLALSPARLRAHLVAAGIS